MPHSDRESVDPFDLNRPSGRSSRTRRDRKARRWPWILLVGLLLVGWFLPAIIVHTPLKQFAVDMALSGFNGKVHVDHVSLGWVSPIEMSGIAAVDRQGQPLFEISTVTTSQPLIGLLKGGDYGEISLQSPTVHARVRPDGSNLEDAVANWITPSEQTGENKPAAHQHSLPRVSISIQDGTIHISGENRADRWTIDSVSAVAKTMTDQVPLSIEAQGHFIENENPVGGLALNCHVDAGGRQLDMQSFQVAVNSQDFPLSLMAPWLERFVGPTETTGYLSGELQVALDSREGKLAVNTPHTHFSKLAFAAPQVIGRDRISIESLSCNGQIELSPKYISASQFQLDSDVGRIQADGTFCPEQLSRLTSEGALLTSPFQMEGKVDLARIAAMLSDTIRLHDDIDLESGQVSFQATSKRQDESSKYHRVVFNVDTANIRARRGGQFVSWQKPLRLTGILNNRDGGVAVEDFQLESDFIEVRGQGSLYGGQLSASGDLSQLLDRAGQFVDFGDVQLSGHVDARLAWQLTDDQLTADASALTNRPIRIAGHMDVAQPSLAWPNFPRWQPDQVSIEMKGQGVVSDQEQLQLDLADLEMNVGTERFVATLAERVENVWKNERWKFNCHANGNLQGWLAHTRNFIDLGQMTASGKLNATCEATLDGETLKLYGIDYAIDQFDFNGYGIVVSEPKLTGKGHVNYNLENGDLAFSKLATRGQSVAAESERLLVSFSPAMRMTGKLNVQSDVHRLAEWYGLATPSSGLQWFGNLWCQIDFQTENDRVVGELNSRLADLVVASPTSNANQIPGQRHQLVGHERQWNEIWRESEILIESSFDLVDNFDAINLRRFSVNANSLNLLAQGSISKLSTALIANLSGTWIPNWELVNSLLDSFAENAVRLRGSSSQAFTIQGPLLASSTSTAGWVHPDLQIHTRVAWDTSEFFTYNIGNGSVDVNLANAIANFDLGELIAGGGRIRLAPQLDLRSEELMLAVRPGVIAEQVKLNPETCRRWLKYVAPLAADATSASGTISVASRGMEMPLTQPAAINAQAVVQLANVNVGAGPLAQQLLGTAEQFRALLDPADNRTPRDHSSWITMPVQEVPVAVQNGRVYHDGLKIAYKDIQIQTRGSVGFDQTIDMVAEIPLQDQWLAKNRWLGQLQGQSLAIPVTGTVTSPRLDQRVIQQLSQNLMRQAAGNMINQAVQEKLGGAPQQVIGDRLNQEIGKAQNKIQNKFQEEVGDKLERELFNGLDQLFNKGRKK